MIDVRRAGLILSNPAGIRNRVESPETQFRTDDFSYWR
jgi:hypothetical protein